MRRTHLALFCPVAFSPTIPSDPCSAPAKDDIVCGNRAGALTVLLDVDGRYAPGSGQEPEGEAAPTHRVTCMEELRTLLQERYALLPPARDVAAAAQAGAESRWIEAAADRARA